jgi:phosphatidylglycerol lysyltransferase
MKPRNIPVALVALITFGSGLINLFSVAIHALPDRMRILEDVFPLEFMHISRLVTLLIGFALVLSAINIYKRKRHAYYAVLVLSVLSIVFHLTKGLNYEEAFVSAVLLVVLALARGRFTVRSSIPSLSNGLFRFGLAAVLAFAYGIAGFWFLDRRDFGIDFHLGDAFRETFRYLGFIVNPMLVPHTRHAYFFIDSLHVITAAAIAYFLYALFRPALYQLRTRPHERAAAQRIIKEHGRSGLDFFKFWPDKSYFFSPSRESFVSYGVGRNFAIALGDPVGPDAEIEGIIREFGEFCRENDWGVGFHQTLPDFVPLYERLGFKKLKVGDDAITDLATFSLDGRERKALRHAVNKLEAEGLQYSRYDPPIPLDILSQLRRVSDEWLEGRGRRERRFTLGTFESRYVRSTPIAAALDAGGTILAFANLIPSYAQGESTIDLMRFGAEAPVGTMDFLFVKLFLDLKAGGYARFNLGMAPMSGFQEHENPSVEEKVIHSFFQHLNFLFSYRGLKRYKSKFATSWEPRYTIYRTQLDLPRLALALRQVSEIRAPKRSEIESPIADENMEDEPMFESP